MKVIKHWLEFYIGDTGKVIEDQNKLRFANWVGALFTPKRTVLKKREGYKHGGTQILFRNLPKFSNIQKTFRSSCLLSKIMHLGEI